MGTTPFYGKRGLGFFFGTGEVKIEGRGVKMDMNKVCAALSLSGPSSVVYQLRPQRHCDVTCGDRRT